MAECVVGSCGLGKSGVHLEGGIWFCFIFQAGLELTSSLGWPWLAALASSSPVLEVQACAPLPPALEGRILFTPSAYWLPWVELCSSSSPSASQFGLGDTGPETEYSEVWVKLYLCYFKLKCWVLHLSNEKVTILQLCFQSNSWNL